MSRQTMPLGEGEVRVYLADPDRITSRPDAALVLSPDDRAHVSRFRFERDQNLARASRALQRYALSACAPVDASAWEFAADDNGKPFIVAPTMSPALSFSVANTSGLVACAVNRGCPVGIDVERVRSDVPFGVVERCWSREERATFDGLAPDDQRRRFVEMWTVKEAYAKARGLGLSIDLRHVEVLFNDVEPQLRLDPSLQDDAAGWCLFVWAPTPSHAAAVCLRTGGGRPVRFVRAWLGGESLPLVNPS